MEILEACTMAHCDPLGVIMCILLGRFRRCSGPPSKAGHQYPHLATRSGKGEGRGEIGLVIFFVFPPKDRLLPKAIWRRREAGLPLKDARPNSHCILPTAIKR